MTTPTPFCAICTSTTSPLKTETLDGKTILTCQDCRELHPRDGNYSFGESSGGEATPSSSTPTRIGNR